MLLLEVYRTVWERFSRLAQYLTHPVGWGSREGWELSNSENSH